MTTLLKQKESAALTHPLSKELNLLGLYAFLSGNGKRPDTMMFERCGGVSLLLDQAALRVESRGHEVTAIALSPNGQILLDHLRAKIPHRLGHSLSDRAAFRFPEIRDCKAEGRLKAPGPFDVLREVITSAKGRPVEEAFARCCMGTIAYDHVDFHEGLPPATSDPLEFPDFLFWVPESLVVFEPGVLPRAVCRVFDSPDGKKSKDARLDAERRLVELVARCGAAPPLSPWSVSPTMPDFSATDMDDETFEELIRVAKAHIRAGDVYQIVPSRTFFAQCPDAFRAFRALCAVESTPYVYFVAEGYQHLLGASPETAVQVTTDAGGNVVEINPLAGTRARGSTSDEDDRIEAELRTDAKEVAEHLMLVDLARNDVARISVTGTRHVPSLMHVQQHSRVMHLASVVQGELRPGLDAFHAALACLNVGTLTGAPKIRATQLLRQLEPSKRGPYGGAIGWFNGQGAMDSAVTIRTAVVHQGRAFVRAGAGIVHDSDPKAEVEETKRKAAAILSALAGAVA